MTKRELSDAISRETKIPHLTVFPVINSAFRILQKEITDPKWAHQPKIILIPSIGKLTYTPAQYTTPRSGGDLSKDKTGHARMRYQQATLKFDPLPPVKEFLRSTRITLSTDDAQEDTANE